MKKIPMSSWLKNMFGGKKPSKRRKIDASTKIVPTHAEQLESRTLLTVDITVSGILGLNSSDYAGVSGDQDGRLFRDGNPSVAGVAKAYPGNNAPGTPYSFDSYSFPSFATTASVATITAPNDSDLFSVAYDGFNSADISVNYLGDAGSSDPEGPYAIDLAGSQSFQIVTDDNSSNGANLGRAYSFTVSLDITDVVITGTGGADDLVVTATGPNSGTFSLNGGPTFNFSGLTSFTFDAGGGGDTLTINNPAGGLFAPVDGITFTGGGTLENLGGGDATSNVGLYTPINTTDGTLTHTLGAAVQTINFTGLSPVTDTVAALTFTIDATADADTINITDGPGGTTQVNSNTFELINFANKTAVTINLLAGNDGVTIDATVAAAGLTSLTVNGGTEADTINVEQTIAGVTTTVNGDAGDDVINIGDTGSLDGILGALTVNGGANTNTLNILDASDASGNTYDVTGTSVTRNTTQVINLSGINVLAISAGTGADTFNVTNLTLTGGGLTLSGNDGTDSATLDNVDISGASNNGLTVTDVETVTIQNGSTFSNNADDGIDLLNVGAVTIGDTVASDNGGHGINIQNAGAVSLTNVTANGNDPGVFVDTAASFSDTDGTYSNNDVHGIQLIDIAGDVTLTRTTANDNDADFNGYGDGVNATDGADLDTLAIGGSLIVNGGTFNDTTGFADNTTEQEQGFRVGDVGVNVTFDGSVDAINVIGNENRGVEIDDVTGDVTFTNGSYSSNSDDGVNINLVGGNLLATDVTASNNDSDGLEIDAVTGTATVTNGDYSGNGTDGLDIDNVVGLITLTNVTASNNDDNGIELNNNGNVDIVGGTIDNNSSDGVQIFNAGDVTITGGSYSENDDDGIGIFTVTSVSLTDVTANGNDANDDGSGDGAYLNNITAGPIVILGGTYNGLGTQKDGIRVTDSGAARVYIGNDGATVNAVTASGNDEDGINIDDVLSVSLDTVTSNNNGDEGFEITDVSDFVILIDLTLTGNTTDGGTVDTVGELIYTTSRASADDTVTLTTNSITRNTPAQQTINYSSVAALGVATGLGDDIIDVQGTGANSVTAVAGGSGNDTITIAGSNLTALNFFFGDEVEDAAFVTNTTGGTDYTVAATPGNDQFILNITTDITATGLEINGNGNGADAGGATANRDRLTINDNNAEVSRAMSFDYQSQTAGDIGIDGFAVITEGLNLETVISNKAGLANDVEVHGTGISSEDITVAPIDVDSAMVFIGTDAAGGGWNGPPADFFSTLPGIAGGSFGPDLRINAIDASGLQVFNDNAGGTTNHQVYVDSSSEAAVVDGTAIDQFGLGAGVLVPGFEVAFDDIDIDSTAGVSTVEITNTTVGPLVNVVLPQATDFTQFAPPMGEVKRPGLIVNAGFEAGLRPGTFLADDITADTSLQFYTKINGGNPVLTLDPVTGTPQGDQLNFTSVGDINVYSDGAVIPNVTVTDSVLAGTGISFSSIERSVNTPGTGTVNIIGDNNDDAVDQNDVFVVRGEVIPTIAQATPEEAHEAFSLQIGGNKDTAAGTVDLSARIYFIGVTRINAFGGSDEDLTTEEVDTGIDTLDITPYADNTPLGWGIETFWNEGDPVLDGDLLIFNGVLGISDDITIAPSSPEAGQVFSINAATGTPIAVVNYVFNGAIIINGNTGALGDTDKLTLRGTDGVSPNTSGDDSFDVDYDADGTAASPFIVVEDIDSGLLLYNLQNVTNLDVVHIDALAGFDEVTIDDTGAGAGGFQNTSLNIQMGDGVDQVDASGVTNTDRDLVINGGAGIDIIIGGEGDDLIDGGDADDFLSGNGGLNLIYGGLGNDIIFVDEEGEGSFTAIDGGEGVDAVLFTGTAGVDAYSLVLGILPDSVGVSTPNNEVNAASIENIAIDTGDDADTVDVADLFGTSLTQLTVAVGGAGDADVVTVEGRNSSDNLNLSTDGADVTLTGLIYEIIIAAATPAARIVVNANDGDDVVKANAGVEAVIGITLNGEEGDDILSADAIISGGAGDDVLQGGAGDDTISGGDGDDDIYFAAGGTDDIDGGDGFDRFIIESGNGLTTMNISETAVTVDGGTETFNTFTGMELVLVNATAGADNITVGLTAVNGVILGGYGDDTINGATSTVPLIIDGGLGNDTLTGGSAADTIYGVDGNDTIVGGDGADTLNGGVGNDDISGGLGDDTIDGGDGFDTLTGGVGADTLIGGGDGDNFILATGDGEDYIEGGSGADWVTFNSTGGAVDVTLATNGFNITTATNDADVYGVEELDIDGTAAANQITIGDLNGSGLEFLNVELSGAADTVTVNGQNSADDITVSSPGAGAIEIDGLAFEMLIEATAAADTLTVNGNQGNDTIKANEGVETQIGITLNGGAGDDFLSADATINGGLGNDTLVGGNGDDTINGNEGDDTILFSAGGTDTINGGDGFDRILVTGSGAGNVISVSQTAITVDGQTENLTITGGIELFEVDALGGNDNITVTLATIAGHVDAGEGTDVVIGTASAAALHIDGGDGNDDITGGAGDDVVDAGNGNDLVRGGLGADQLNGGDGADVFFWSLGDGSDVVTGGGDGADRLEFTGDGAANIIDLAATPGHATVTLGAATVDTTGVENLQINALGGDDTITVGDLSTSNVTSVGVDTGAGSDDLIVNGRTTADILAVSAPSATTLKIQGLAYDLNASNVSLPDDLIVNGGQGDDEIKAASGVETTVNITFNGGLGNDFLSADATLNGDEGDDVLVGGVGNDALNGGSGDDTLTGNGGVDAFDGGGGYDTVVETRNTDFTITNTTLIIGAEGTDTLAFIENAELSGRQGNNVFTIGAFTGDTTIFGAGGSDTVDFSTTTQGIHIDLDAKGVDQIINLAGRKIVFADIIENLNASPFNDTIEVDIAQFNRTIDGGLEDSIPPGDRLNVDLLGSNANSTKVPNGGKLGSFNGTVNGSGFTGTIAYFDIETLVIKSANSTPPDFSSATQYDMGDGPRGVITADFDGDGILDMATANSISNNISVRLGDGFGNFGPVVNYSAGGKQAKQTTTIAGGDVDGDGDIDLVVTNRKTNNVSVLLGNGDGTFGTATLYSTGDKKTGKFPTGVKLGDMDGDGNLDIVTANSNVGKNGSFSILLGDGAGGFGTANVTATKGRRPRDLVLIDVDGDTNLDVVATNLFSKSVFVLNGNGAGGLGAPTSIDVAVTPNSIISGDFNGDGILDVVTTSLVSPRLSLLLGNGTGFDPVKEIKYPATKLDISINSADINGDGNLDLLIANRNDNTVSYMLGNGNGSFQNRVDFKTGNTIFREPVAIAYGDFNNDGAIDLMIANAGSDDVSVLIHVGIV